MEKFIITIPEISERLWPQRDAAFEDALI